MRRFWLMADFLLISSKDIMGKNSNECIMSSDFMNIYNFPADMDNFSSVSHVVSSHVIGMFESAFSLPIGCAILLCVGGLMY